MPAVIHLARWLPRRVAVEGTSMVPTLLPGDRLLVVPARRYRAGDLVALRDPRDARRVMVKRIHRAIDSADGEAGYLVLGDNADASTDSRAFGSVARAALVGRVAYRYGPSGRAGPVRRAPRGE